MEDRLSILKRTFGEIVDLKEVNINAIKTLNSKIQQIQTMYRDFIQSNKEQLFVFSLDAFHFQSKLLDLEYEDMNRMFLSITNRMYCDYYKLFRIMVDYTKENIPDKKLSEMIKVHDNFPLYKDLEPFKQYDFQYIQGIHEIILVIITYLNGYLMKKDNDLKMYQTKNQIGLNIDSFVNTFNYNNIVMKEKIMLFTTYIEFFHKLHTKYLKRFTTKSQLMLSQVNHDIKLDNPETSKTNKKNVINVFKDENIDQHVLKDLKESIRDDNDTVTSESNEKSPRSSSNASNMDMNVMDDIDPKNVENTMNINMSELTDEYGTPSHSPITILIEPTIIEEGGLEKGEEDEKGEEVEFIQVINKKKKKNKKKIRK